MRPPTTLRLLLTMERPTNGQFAIAAFLGIVIGALGGGFALALGLFLGILGVIALWKVVTLLGYIAAALDDQRPAPAPSRVYGGHR